MKDTLGPPLKAAAVLAFVTGLVMMMFNPPTFAGLGDLLAIASGVVAIVLVTAWATVMLIGDEMPEPRFRRLVDRSEALATLPPVSAEPSRKFDELVAAAIDDLPIEFQRVLEDVPIVVSDLGAQHRAYGHYIGDTVARDYFGDHIVIYRDTLERDFGHDPELLRAQVERTVRHEIAHHLGWDERGVRDLGL